MELTGSHVQGQNSTAFPILSLPEELLRSICTELRLDQRREDLYNMCLTCKPLRDAAQPELFNMFSIAFEDPRAGRNIHSSGPISEETVKLLLAKFTRALLERPKLAKSVRTIDIALDKMRDDGMPELKMSEHTLLANATRKISPEIPYWFEWTETRGIYAMLDIIFTALSNLRTIHLRLPINLSESDRFKTWFTAQDIQSLFPNLEELAVCCNFTHPQRLGNFVDFLLLPKLRSVSIEEFLLPEDRDSRWLNLLQATPKSSRFSQLRFHQCTNASRDTLKFVLNRSLAS